jgi:hypothetical protein
MSSDTNTPSFANMRQEQLPIPKHKLHGWPHFVGLHAAEHVAATEFVIGATFVASGCKHHGYPGGIVDRQCPGDFELDPQLPRRLSLS